MEILRDRRGSTTNGEGVPYNETFTKKEGRRLQFYKHLAEKDPVQPKAEFMIVNRLTNPLRRNGPFWTKK